LCGNQLALPPVEENFSMTTGNQRPPFRTLITTSITTIVFFPALTLLLAGNWLWLEGWIFALWMVSMILSIYFYLYFKDPALLAERSKRPGSNNQQGWDKYVLSGIYLMAIVWLVIMPLDAQRFGWSPTFPAWLKVLGGVALIPSLYLIFRATADNTFLSTQVRIQSERKQHVISTGVYGLVRHPLYLGCVLLMLGGPLLLGSIVGLIISAIALVVLVARTIGEEKMLVNELEGYAEYKHKVRYRLIPFVW
jgi:protein-S-isoprenylcysteine O-methyltransferase Ste14